MERWRDRKQSDGPEDRAGALLRSVRPHQPSAELEERVQAVLRGDDVPLRSTRRPLPALAVVASLLLVAGGATAAGMIYQTWVAPAEKVEPKPKPPKKRVAPPPVIAPEPIPEPPPPIVEAPPPPPKPKAPDPSELAKESKRIKAAVDALRKGDAGGALDEIAAYEREHPQGVLHREALLAKVSALVASNREAEALGLLDARSLDAHPRSLELTILRGELRARADRCGEAVADFEGALAKQLEEKLRVRAEKGLLRCKK